MSITLTMHLICKVGSISLLSLCYLVNRGRELWFGIINWVDNVNWPPLSVSKLTFGALALRQSEWRRANARNFSLETLYGDQLHHQLSWYCRITLLFLPPTQHHSLVRNPLYSSEIGSSPGHVDKHFFSSFYYLSPFTPYNAWQIKKTINFCKLPADFTQKYCVFFKLPDSELGVRFTGCMQDWLILYENISSAKFLTFSSWSLTLLVQ